MVGAIFQVAFVRLAGGLSGPLQQALGDPPVSEALRGDLGASRGVPGGRRHWRVDPYILE